MKIKNKITKKVKLLNKFIQAYNEIIHLDLTQIKNCSSEEGKSILKFISQTKTELLKNIDLLKEEISKYKKMSLCSHTSGKKEVLCGMMGVNQTFIYQLQCVRCGYNFETYVENTPF